MSEAPTSSLQNLSLGSSPPSSTRDYSTVDKVVRQFGSSGKGDLQFINPYGMAIDGKERIFVADADNHRIQCFDSEGNFLFKFGSKGTGNGEFNRPKDVAFDSKNQRILVADPNNHRIQLFDLEGVFLFAFGAEGTDNNQFKEPFGVAVDQGGNIFVSDHNNHCVKVFDEKGSFLRKFGPEVEMVRPWGIKILSNGDVAVAEPMCFAGGNQRISIFTSQGQLVRSFGAGKLESPWWGWVDSNDNLLFADMEKQAVLVFSKEGDFLKKIGGGFFDEVHGVSMNRKGEIFVTGRGEDEVYRIFVF